MGIKKTLASLVLAGTLLLGAEKSKATNIAYVLEDASQVSPVITSALNERGLTYNIIKDSQIQSTDFSSYSALVITEYVDRASYLPLKQKNAVFLDKSIAKKVWAVGGTGQTSYTKIEAEKENSFLCDGITVPSNDEVQIYTTSSTLHYLNPPMQSGVQTAAIKVGLFRPILSYSEISGIKNVFFGAPVSSNWNSNGKQIFENSLDYVTPEPSTLAFFGLGAAGLAYARRRK